MMMVMFNHAVGMMTSPVGIWFFAMIAVLVCALRRWRKTAWVLGVSATVLLWAFACGWSYRLLGSSLERLYPPVRVADLPAADAIVILGGGMGYAELNGPYPNMNMGADRVWHAARLWKAGKAPVVMSSGAGDLLSTKPLLLDLGVAPEAIQIENESRNTEENAKFIARFLADKTGAKRPRILLVTSACHMRRSMLMFTRYAPALEVIPAACDHEAMMAAQRSWKVADFFPEGETLGRNAAVIKEFIGYAGYKWLRK